jgi:glycosyltransferase involved in cell wall biosynthesis
VQTVEALRSLADVEVFVPNARYPAVFTPRSYRYVPPEDGNELRDAAKVHHVSYPTLPVVGRVLNGYMAARALRKPVRRFRPDLALAYWLYPDAFGAATVASELGIPLVSGARGSDVRARDRITLALTQRALRRSASVLTVSDDLRHLVSENFGISPDKVTTVTNGCDTKVFHLAARGDARRKLGIPDTDKVILYVGRLMPAKGLRELIAAGITLAGHMKNLRLSMIGHGALSDELRGTADAAGIGDRVDLPGALPPEQVAVWMQACDVFCLPSHTEGFPNVLVEALACGRPVVATPVGGIVEIVDGSNGILTPAHDAAQLSSALQEALSKSWDEVELSRKFQRSWKDVARETMSVCESALG